MGRYEGERVGAPLVGQGGWGEGEGEGEEGEGEGGEGGERVWCSPRGPEEGHISPYLPISPHISPYLTSRAGGGSDARRSSAPRSCAAKTPESGREDGPVQCAVCLEARASTPATTQPSAARAPVLSSAGRNTRGCLPAYALPSSTARAPRGRSAAATQRRRRPPRRPSRSQPARLRAADAASRRTGRAARAPGAERQEARSQGQHSGRRSRGYSRLSGHLSSGSLPASHRQPAGCTGSALAACRRSRRRAR